MAASTTTSFAFPTPPAAVASRPVVRRRRIPVEAGRALEILGHAIEYLTDEYVQEGGELSGHNAQIEAIQLLMAVNRGVYFDCPEIPTLPERMNALVHRFLF